MTAPTAATALSAPGFPEAAVRRRARVGAGAGFPPSGEYGHAVYGAAEHDLLDTARLVPPVLLPGRLATLIELGQEPTHLDVDLRSVVGGFHSPLPMYISAFGSTAACADLALHVSCQAGAAGLPMVIGENVTPVNGYTREDGMPRSLLPRVRAYSQSLPDGCGGVVVQQSTEDADAEVWNQVYSDPAVEPLLATGRLGFELKVGQGAKPGLGGITVVDGESPRLDTQGFVLTDLVAENADAEGRRLRFGTPGTFTAEILRQQIRLMRNNYPRARVWVKLPPGRDIVEAVRVATDAGADAVTVDGAQGGTGWAPEVFLRAVGLPAGECLRQLAEHDLPVQVSGGMWEGSRVAKALAMGAVAVGLGRAALLAAEEDPKEGLTRLLDALTLELRLISAAMGKYVVGELSPEDLWFPG